MSEPRPKGPHRCEGVGVWQLWSGGHRYKGVEGTHAIDTWLVLQVHMKVHSSEKKWKCTECGNMFRHKNSLVRHRFVNHTLNKMLTFNTSGGST